MSFFVNKLFRVLRFLSQELQSLSGPAAVLFQIGSCNYHSIAALEMRQSGATGMAPGQHSAQRYLSGRVFNLMLPTGHGTFFLINFCVSWEGWWDVSGRPQMGPILLSWAGPWRPCRAPEDDMLPFAQTGTLGPREILLKRKFTWSFNDFGLFKCGRET